MTESKSPTPGDRNKSSERGDPSGIPAEGVPAAAVEGARAAAENATSESPSGVASPPPSPHFPLGEGELDFPVVDNRLAELIEEIHRSADRLASDHPSRGDVKILSRAIRELRYAFKVFTPYRGRRKVTVFGSARTLPDAPAYQQAVEFGRAMAERKWLVVTGAASGIMEAGHRGAGRENSMGLNIMLPFEQGANAVIAGDPKLVNMKYFFTRKLMFVKECDAVCCLPGGFGTLDEGLEVLTLLQTGKRDMVPIVFLDARGGTFWQDLQRFIVEQLLGNRLISPEDLSLYKLTDSVEEAVAEIVGFFKVYHSMRFVRNKLVLRLQEPIPQELIDELELEFTDILLDDKIVASAALPEERDEPLLAELPRLVLRFNRRSLGRLRQLIDSINAGRIKVPERA